MNPPRTYALVIGIDEYKLSEYDNLRAAVNDANSMKDYLQTTLKVSKENIINLRNEEATRQGILSGFRELGRILGNPDSSMSSPAISRETSVNPQHRAVTAALPAVTPTPVSTTPTTLAIPAFAPGLTSRARADNSTPCIIIFYAGHGARARKPVEWKDWASDDEFVEMLCPSDIGVISEDSGRPTEGIPDRTVCYLLNKLSKRNGNNITLILDCCCSGGMNRSPLAGTEAGQYYPRSISNPPGLSGNVDLEVSHEINDEPTLATRGMRTSKGFGGQFQDSHVLLAACGKSHYAYEEKSRGVFTTALLKLLPRVDLQTTTYASLMKRVALPEVQTPHYSGSNIDRPLFNIQADKPDPSYIWCSLRKPRGCPAVITLDAGAAYGINLNEMFSIHKTNLLEAGETSNPSIGTLTVTSVRMASSTLDYLPGKRKFKLPKSCYAKLIGWSGDKLKVFCEDETFLSSIFPPTKGEIEIVSERAKASLVLESNREGVYISHTDPEMIQYIPARFQHTFKRDSREDIRTIIQAWQKFEFHLRQNGKNKFKEVRMEMYYLKPVDGAPDLANLEGEGLEGSNFEPTGQNLLGHEPAEISFSTVSSKPVGITLYNGGDTPLYPYLFWFDPNNFTITPWFKAPDGAGKGKVDAPLGPHSVLPIGYGGNGGVTPWQFCKVEGRDKDLGFFKLFLSVSPVNLSYLIQEEEDSPFKRLGTGGPRGIRNADEPIEEVLDAESWGCKLATVKQQWHKD